MNRTEMNRVSRKMIADYCESINLNYCENCGGTFGLAPSHKKKRRYYSSAEELADPNEWIALCQPCHFKIEYSKELTEEMFNRLR